MRSSTSTRTVGVEPVARSIDALATAQHARALRHRVGALRFEHVDLRGAASGPTSVPSSVGITDAIRRTTSTNAATNAIEHRRRARTPARSHCTTGRRCSTRLRQPRVPHRRRRRRRPRTRASLPPSSSCTSQQAVGDGVATAPARRVRTREAHHVDVGMRRAPRRSRRRRPPLARRRPGHPARCKQSTMRKPGERRVLRTACRAPRCRPAARARSCSAPRSTGSSTRSTCATSPTGSCVTRSSIAPSPVTVTAAR